MLTSLIVDYFKNFTFLYNQQVRCYF